MSVEFIEKVDDDFSAKISDGHYNVSLVLCASFSVFPSSLLLFDVGMSKCLDLN